MADAGDDAAGVGPTSAAAGAAWKRTNDEMAALAEQRREDGWAVVAVPAVHTDPVGRDQGSEDRFGLVHVIPDNHADDVADAFERGDFGRFEAYRNEIEGDAFLVTELLDDDRELALLIASYYDRRRADAMVRAARETGVLYTHAKTLDGTPLGEVRHEAWKPLVATEDGDATAGEDAGE